MTNTRLYAAQKKYAEKKKSKGDVRVTVWVPENYDDELKSIAKSMRTGKYLSLCQNS